MKQRVCTRLPRSEAVLSESSLLILTCWRPGLRLRLVAIGVDEAAQPPAELTAIRLDPKRNKTPDVEIYQIWKKVTFLLSCMTLTSGT